VEQSNDKNQAVNDKLKESHVTFLIPYMTKDSEGKRICSVEIEIAAILCLSETKRKKPRILAGSPEKISCVSKIYYPLWSVPWNGKCIIIDGLDLLSFKMKFNDLPDVLGFTEDLNRSSSSFNLFLEALEQHSRTFQRFKSSRKIDLNGIVNRPSMLESLALVVNKGVAISEEDDEDAVFVSPIVSEEEAEKRAHFFIDQWGLLNSEIDSLHYAIEVLNRQTEHHKEKISVEIEEIRRDYDLRISHTKKLVNRKVKALVKEKEKIENRIEKVCKRRLEKILRERDRLKQRIDRLNVSLREAVKSRRRQVSRYPKRSTTRIDNKIATYRNDIRILKEKISEIAKTEAEIRKEAQKRLKEIEEKYRTMITEEMEKLEILKEARRLEISEKSELMSRLDHISSIIEAQLRRLIAKKSKEINDLESKAIPANIEETSLIGIPFYLVIFESPRRVRAEIYPPMVAGSSTSTMRKIKRMFFSFSLESRMNLLLNPRFPEFNRDIFLSLEKKVRSNSAFRGLIFERARSNNLLESSKFADSVTKGMDKLEKEGWINHDEKLSIIEMYVKS